MARRVKCRRYVPGYGWASYWVSDVFTRSRLAHEADKQHEAYSRQCAEDDRQWAERFKDTMRMKIAPWQDATTVPPERLAPSDPEE